MSPNDFTTSLLEFINQSPTSFHAVQQAGELLQQKGFVELDEHDSWTLSPGSYFVRRNESSLIAFTLSADNPDQGFRMAGAHTDSPCLKIKPVPVQTNSSFIQLGVEMYGGALLTPWFDRDLSMAGRVTWYDKTQDTIRSSLIDFKRPIAVIPSLAIHLDRKANEKKSVNKQTDLVPVIMEQIGNDEVDFKKIISDQLIQEHPDINDPRIIDHELFLYDIQPASFLGLNKEFITGARLDNLLSCYTLLRSLLDSDSKHNSLIVLNDHEEVGSLSASGAQGTFLQSVLERLVPDHESRQRSIRHSLFISVDNAHAVHPNFPDRYDKGHLPKMNRGPVIKYNANQRYATNSLTGSFFRMLCEKSDVPVQEFVMNNSLACGSTIGPLTAGEIGIQTVDVGAPTLAMHSIREMAGRKDARFLYTALTAFFKSHEQDVIWQCIT